MMGHCLQKVAVDFGRQGAMPGVSNMRLLGSALVSIHVAFTGSTVGRREKSLCLTNLESKEQDQAKDSLKITRRRRPRCRKGKSEFLGQDKCDNLCIYSPVCASGFSCHRLQFNISRSAFMSGLVEGLVQALRLSFFRGGIARRSPRFPRPFTATA